MCNTPAAGPEGARLCLGETRREPDPHSAATPPGVAPRTPVPTGLVFQKESEPSRISPWGGMRSAGRRRHTPGMVAPPEPGGARSRAAHIALVLFVGLYIVVFLLKLLGLAEIPSGDSALVNVAVYGALFLLGAVAFHRELARAARQVAARRGGAVLILIAGLLGVIAATMLGGWLAAVLLESTGLWGTPLQNDLIIGRATEAISPFVLIPIGGVIGPLAEELMFRQFLIGLIGRCAPAWAAVVVSGILFGMLHMSALTLPEAINVIPHACTGIAFGALYVASGRNLCYSSTIHVFNNLTGLLAPVL